LKATENTEVTENIKKCPIKIVDVADTNSQNAATGAVTANPDAGCELDNQLERP